VTLGDTAGYDTLHKAERAFLKKNTLKCFAVSDK